MSHEHAERTAELLGATARMAIPRFGAVVVGARSALKGVVACMSDVEYGTSHRQVMRLTLPPEMVSRIAADIMREVCELDGYTSPDGQPDLLQCTAAELETCIRRALGEDV